MAFEDIARTLGQIATGWQQGTTEREQADRTEQQRLTEQAIAHGSRGEDYATFFVPENFRPGTEDTLARLQRASGPVGPGVSGQGMLQYPFSARINLQAEREDAARNAAEISQQQHAQDAEASQMRLFQQQQDLLLQRQQAQQNRQRTTLNPNEWEEMRVVMGTVIDDALAPQMPDYFVPNPRGGMMPNPLYADARARMLRSMENRLPMQLPMDRRSLGTIMQGIYADMAPGITVTPRGTGMPLTGWWPSAGALTYDESRARARRPETGTGSGTPGTTALPPTGQPGQVGQSGQPTQVGRSGATEEARTQRTLQNFQGPIEAAGREFNISPGLLAAVFGSGEGGQMVQGPVIPGRTERAFGVAQVLPSTYNQVARELREGRPITDPYGNIRVGTAYFAKQLRDYNGDVMLALAAYNWGPENLNRMMNRFPNGVPRQTLYANMPRETQAYIERIGAGAGGWDGPDRNSLPRFSGGSGTLTTQPQGTPTGNVTQRAPTAQEQGSVNQYIDLTIRSIATRITSSVNPTERRALREQLLAALPDAVRRRYSPALVDHIVYEVTRQLSTVS
jgi:hypothetical protein